jgi:23S rRNA (uracil1939-C5)-methyltransferase
MRYGKGCSVPKAKLAGFVEADVIRIGGQGDGVCQTATGASLFTPFTLPGEAVRIEAHGERGELLEVLAASPDRIEPVCPHFFACGGCALQHWSHAPYLEWKQTKVREALAREGLEAEMAPPFAAAPGSRRRLALHARRGDRPGDRVRLGYKERRSWSLVDIETCPIAHPRLVAAFPALRMLAAPFLEHPKSAPTLHVTLTATGLDIDITGGLSADARVRAAAIAAKADFARVTMAGEVVYMARQPMVRLGPAVVALPPGGFLQAVPEAEEAMAAFAVAALQGAHRIADLFCGSGAFTFRLAAIAPVFAVDSEAAAIKALIAATASAPGLKSITAEARDLFRRPVLAQDLKKIDAVLFDPPRVGADIQAAQIAASKVERVVGVSCEPGSFARDAKILTSGGFRLERIMVVDQFLWSPHVELVGVFSR